MGLFDGRAASGGSLTVLRTPPRFRLNRQASATLGLIEQSVRARVASSASSAHATPVRFPPQYGLAVPPGGRATFTMPGLDCLARVAPAASEDVVEPGLADKIPGEGHAATVAPQADVSVLHAADSDPGDDTLQREIGTWQQPR